MLLPALSVVLQTADSLQLALEADIIRMLKYINGDADAVLLP